jgi:hypothetical protein
MGRNSNTHRILVGRPEKKIKTPLGRPVRILLNLILEEYDGVL